MHAVIVTMPEGATPIAIGPIRKHNDALNIAGLINHRAVREEPGIAASAVWLVKAASDYETLVFGDS
jgi:hypothetical protein